MNKLLICDQCEVMNVESLQKKLINLPLKIEIGCHNLCAIGQKKQFAVLNGQVLMAETEDELVEKIKNSL